MVVELIKPLFARCDLHVHTALSPCGWEEMTPGAIVRAAVRQGIEHLAITDHVHPFTDLSILDRVRDDCRRIDSTLNLYIGCEVDIISVGEAAVDGAIVEKTDFVMAAANHFHSDHVSRPASLDNRDIARHYLDMFAYAASLDFVDVIAHPLYVMPGSYDPLTPALLEEDDLLPAIEVAARNNVAVEISRRALAPEQMEFLLSFYRLCKSAGVKFSIGSDAHQLADVGKTINVEPLIRRLGLTDDDIWVPGKGTGDRGK